jgi:CRISPR type I-E-associated protein CasB/Cse2
MTIPAAFARDFSEALCRLAAVRREEDETDDEPRALRQPDRAALAALRRGLGRQLGELAEPYRVLLTLPGAYPLPHYEDACFLVAGLFAWHQLPRLHISDGLVNLGASLRQHADSTSGNGAERRFVALLNADHEDLAVHLRHVVGLLRVSGTRIDYARLLRDVHVDAWNAETRYVQRAWSRAFWRPTADAQAS